MLQTLKCDCSRGSVELGPTHDVEQAEIVNIRNDSGKLLDQNAIVRRQTWFQTEIVLYDIEATMKDLQSGHLREPDLRNANNKTRSSALTADEATVMDLNRRIWHDEPARLLTSIPNHFRG